MAKLSNLQLFINTDSHFLFTIYNDAETECVDISTWTLSFMAKTYPQDADASAVISKTTSSGVVVSGTFAVDPDDNTQQANVTIEDSDTINLNPGTYFWEFKRTDSGFETVLAYGQLELIVSVHAG